MSSIAVYGSLAQQKKASRWLYVPLVLAGIAAAGWLGVRLFGGGPAAPGGTFYTVSPVDLDVKVVKHGELQAIRNTDIHSRVEGRAAIQFIVDEGTAVTEGEVLVELDSATIRQRLEDTTLQVQRAEAELTDSRERREIQLSQNAANLQAAEVAQQLAQLDLAQYTEGTYPQRLADARTTLDMARIHLANRQDDYEQTRRLLSRGFVTSADVKKAELDVKTAENSVAKAEKALHVLTEYTHQMDMASKRNAVAQAEQRVARVLRENASSLAQRDADVRNKEQSLASHRRRQEHLEEQLAACTILAPADGMVIYGSTGNRNQQEMIQQGSEVRQRQLLLRLPDVNAMKAVVRIPESQVPQLKVGQRASVSIVGVPEPMGATVSRISVLADGGARWWNPDLKEYPVDLTLDQTPPDLKPGVGVQAEIFVHRLSDVLAVPLPAIYSAGGDSYVFVRQGGQFTPVLVDVGHSSTTHVQITDGLAPGTSVLLLESGQGRELLELAGIRITPPGVSPEDVSPAAEDMQARVD